MAVRHLATCIALTYLLATTGSCSDSDDDGDGGFPGGASQVAGGEGGGESAQGGSSEESGGADDGGATSSDGGSSNAGGSENQGGQNDGGQSQGGQSSGGELPPECASMDGDGFFSSCGPCPTSDCDTISVNGSTRYACGCSEAACPCGLSCGSHDIGGGITIGGLCVK
jgi:hypothetical protein